MSAYPAEVERKVRTWKDMMCSHRRQSLISGILLLLSCLIPVVTSALDDSPTTPDTVWAGFDPRHEPLEIEISSTGPSTALVTPDSRSRG
jgi:hypothetical protein